MTQTEDLARRLSALLEDGLREEPPAPPIAEVVSGCASKHQRRRRRAVLGSAVLLTLTALAPVAIALMRSEERQGTPDPGVASMTDEQVVSLCLNGNQGDFVTSVFQASGTPEVRARGTVAEMSTVILVSADERYWADCFINHYAGAEFHSGMTVYDGRAASKGTSYSAGHTCKDLDGPPSDPCDTFMVDYVDRLPDAVAAVDFTTADGKTTRVPTLRDGFVLFTYEGRVPRGYSNDPDSEPQRWLTRITYVGHEGESLAAANTGFGLKDVRVGRLPLLDSYPSLRSDPIQAP